MRPNLAPGVAESLKQLEGSQRAAVKLRQKALTWEQQQNVWLHLDVGNAFLAGEMTRSQYDYLVAGMEPLPTISETIARWSVARARARVHKMPPKPGTKEPPVNERPKPLSAAQLAAVQAKTDRLRAMHPQASAGQILRMLEDAR